MKALSVHFRAEQLGGHTHVAVFAGPDEDHRAKCGDLVFRNEEWQLLAPVLVAADRTIRSAVAFELTDVEWVAEQERRMVSEIPGTDEEG